MGPDGNPHAALLYADNRNHQAQDGAWSSSSPQLAQYGYGWQASFDGVTVSFPKALDPQTPVRLDLSQGTISLAPLAAKRAAGTADQNSASYPSALASTDFTYLLSPGGYDERVMLNKGASPALSWDVRTTGSLIGLSADPSGEIIISAQGTPVAAMPTPVATDANGKTSVGTYVLKALNGGHYELDLALDPSFVSSAAYPIVVDPGQATLSALRDTYVDEAASNKSFDALPFLKTDGGVGTRKRAFIRFDTSTLQVPDRLVYSANLILHSTAADQNASVDAAGVSSAWPTNLTWNSQPAGGPVVDSANANAGQDSTFHLKSLYQGYLDTSAVDNGVRLSSSRAVTYSSSEATNAANRPALAISYNDLPATPVQKAPITTAGKDPTVETSVPVFRVQRQSVTDPNGDEVLLRFQVTADPSCATGSSSCDFSNPVAQSNWSDERSFTPPASALTDGNTYFWRVQAMDVCGPNGELCSRLDGAGVTHPIPTSPAQGFTVAMAHLGEDPNYQMFSHDLGNNISIGVNEANGNLYASVPFDQLTTEIGDIGFGLSYNSEDLSSNGMGFGWNLYAGPLGETFPIRIEQLAPAGEGVKIVSSDGSRSYFALSDDQDGTFVPVGAGTGNLIQNSDSTYTFEPSDGGTYTFDSSGNLSAVRFPGTTIGAASNGAVLTYTVDGAGHITSVTDPLGRHLSFTWSSATPKGTLTAVTSWDNRSWSVSVTPGLLSVTDPLGERISFASSLGQVTEVKDGAITADGGAGWKISYSGARVAQVLPPGGGASSSPTPWQFSYVGTPIGFTSPQTLITDPRGFQSSVDFNTMGLPVRVAGPADQTGYVPIETRLWDENENLVCDRSTTANADLLRMDPTNCPSDSLSSTYRYQDTAPFRMTDAFEAAPQASVTGVHDEISLDSAATQSQGLNFSIFSGTDQKGVPAAQSFWRDPLSHDYGTTRPPEIGNSTGAWSLRWKGLLQTTGPAQSYDFRLFSTDGIRFTVANDTLVNCYAQNQSASFANCGNANNTPRARILLGPGSWPVTIRYSAIKGQASFDMRWDSGCGTQAFCTIPASALLPNIGLANTDKGAVASDGSRLVTQSSYQNDKSLLTRLPDLTTQQASGAGVSDRTTSDSYDQMGRLTSETAPSGAGPATTQSTYDSSSQCPTQVTGPITGQVTTNSCNARGDITQENVFVRAVADQPAQTRTTNYTYDALGRTLTEDPPGPGLTTYTYDASGRVLSQDQLVATGDHAITTYAYDDAGRLKTQTNPDGGVVNFTYDWTDNQITQSDPRSASFVTQMQYDAWGREISMTSPSGLSSTTQYKLLDAQSFVNEQIDTDSAGVQTITKSDDIGQQTSSKTGTLDPTTYKYDQAGNQTVTADPTSGVTTDSYNAFGDLTMEKTPVQGSGDATTSYSYDNADDQVSVNGPRNVGDVTNYSYDGAGRLVSVQQAGLPAPNTTRYAYDDAGELVKVDQPMSATQSEVRTFAYDENGNQTQATDANGTTAMFYDAANRLSEKDLPNGYMLTYSYDDMGRMIDQFFFGNGYTGGRLGCRPCDVANTYDKAGELVHSVRDGIELFGFYDSDQRVTDFSFQSQGGVPTADGGTDYVYDPHTGQLQSVFTDAGRLSYGYDSNGLLQTVGANIGGAGDLGTVTYSYDSAGRVIGRADPNGDTWTQAYEPSTGLISSRTIKDSSSVTLAHFALGYDAAQNVTSRTEIVKAAGGGDTPGSGTWNYSYDAENRLVSATDPSNQTTSYGYDNAGNRTSVQVGNASPVTSAYDNAGDLVSSDAGTPNNPADDTLFGHDAIGNQTSVDKPGTSGDRCYFYDGYSELASVSLGQSSGCDRRTGDILYIYDSLNRLFVRTPTAPQTPETLFTYQGTGSDLATSTNVTFGRHTALVLNTPMGPLVTNDTSFSQSGAAFLLPDLHGDTVGLADVRTGQVTGSKLYSPWGEPQAQSGDNSILGFQSQPTDADTGFVKTDTRWYDSSQGRFTTMDSLLGDTQNPASLNQFAFGSGNPVTYADPSGEDYCRPSGYEHLHWNGSSTLSRVKVHICFYTALLGNIVVGVSNYPHGYMFTKLTRTDNVDYYSVRIWIYDRANHRGVPGTSTTNNIRGSLFTNLESKQKTKTGERRHGNVITSSACYAAMNATVYWKSGRSPAQTQVYGTSNNTQSCQYLR